jgi:hypothetical protein
MADQEEIMASFPVSHDELNFSDALSVTCFFINPFYYLEYKGTNNRFQGHVVTKKEGLMTSLTDFNPGTVVLCFEVKTIIGLAFCCLSPLTRACGNIGSEDRRTNSKSERFLILELSSVATSSFCVSYVKGGFSVQSGVYVCFCFLEYVRY